MKVKLDWKIYAVLGMVLILGFIAWQFLTPGKYDDFAECLSEKGVVMYGAEWCPRCKDQKAMFGKSFKFVSYVECPQNRKLCVEKGVDGYPTWIINERLYSGVRSLESLSSLSGCSL